MLDYTNLFSPNQYENDYKDNNNNDNQSFSITKMVKMNKIYFVIWDKYRKFKNPKIYIFWKILVRYIICSKFENQDGAIFKEGKSY